jgi:peptide/nickel transport system substrate-binding protein
VRLANLKSGGLDLIERVLATDIKSVRDTPRLKLSKVVSLGYSSLMVNLANGSRAESPLGKDARVRRALQLSIDRDAINQVVFNGEFVAGNQWVNPQHPYYQAKFPVPKRDLAKAKALLAEAGVTGRLPVDLMVTNTPETRSVAEVLQAMAAEAGIDLKIRVTETATALKQGEDGNFQIYMNWWSGRSDPDGNSYVHQTCGAPQNLGHYCDKEIDAWHGQARAANDPGERKAIYEKIAARFLAEGSLMYLYHPQMLIASTDKVEGFKPVPDGLVRVVGLRLK